MLGFSEFGTSLNALIIKETLMNDFSPACLDCEVILRKGYLRFARVAVLRNNITCIASQHDIIYLTFSAFTECYHFADVRKMIRYGFPSI